MQKQLKPNEEILKIEDKQLLFRLRCKTTDVEMNMKGLYEEYKCRACGLEDESQEHVTNCDILLKMNDEGEIVEYEKLNGWNISDLNQICK